MSRHDRTPRAGADRANLYDEITGKIIAELEAGRVPWVQPWGSSTAKAPLGLPKNAATCRTYSGINILILWGAVIEHGFPGQGWLTFRQALSLGGNVRKGERGTTVVYADRFVPEDEKQRARETGEDAQAIPFLKRFTVFNAAQCEGLPDDLAVAAPPTPQGLIEPKVEALIKATGIDFRIGGNRAFYMPARDYVQVPPPQAYFEPINWHRTALHEIGHASGHHSRLNRDLSGSFGTKKYAFEELVAEMSSAFACASLGIVPTVRHADYIGSWLETLREDSRAVVRAASQASKRARFVGLDAYMAAGGPLLPRYLFDDDEEGWLENVPLLDRLVAEKLKAAAAEVASEGWKWVVVDLELPYGYDCDLRAITSSFPKLSRKERREREKLRKEQERLEAEHADYDELPDEIDQRLGEIEKQLEAFERRPAVYDPADIAVAGAFVTVDEDGELVVDRGWVRPEDEPVDGDAPQTSGDDDDAAVSGARPATITIAGQPTEPAEDEETIKPLPERLAAELTAHRTVALRDAVGANPHVAMTALLHKLARDTFKRNTSGAAVQVSVREVYCSEQGIDLKDSPYAKSVIERHESWKADVPTDDDALWDWLEALDEASRMALLAHCVSFGINALYERPNPHSAMGISEHGLQRRMVEADRLQRTTGLDMVEAGFRPTVANYLGRVTKPRILEAVHEALGEEKARLIDHLRKDDMAHEAERLLADTGWLPEPLRLLAEEPAAQTSGEQDDDGVALPDFLAGDDEAAAEAPDDPTVLTAAE